MHHVSVIAAPPRSGRPCWHCRWFTRTVYGGSAAWCTLPNGPRVQAGPADGCSAWERLPGVDDEVGSPEVTGTVRASTVHAVVVPVVAMEWAP
jgi:hypothetical protein